MKKLKIFIVLIVVGIITVSAAGYFLLNSWGNPLDTNNKEMKAISIPEGSATIQIAEILEKEEIISNAKHFRYYAKLKGFDGKFLAGTYFLSASMSADEIFKITSSGNTASTNFTIPEGYNINLIGQALEKQGIVTKEEFLAAASKEYDYKFLKNTVDGDRHLEGYLYPDTYQIPLNSSAEDIIKLFLDNFDNKFDKELYARIEKNGKSLNEIMTIASIVEREAQKKSEQKTISGVIYNRLEEDMLLQMDSTIQYLFDKQRGMVYYEDLEIDSPYNTYKNKGLPPGPIGSPGIDAIKAAIEPEKTDYIYFVVSSKLDGSHKFSKDYEKFEKDKEAYNKAYEEKYGTNE